MLDSPVSLFKCLADETRLRLALLVADQGELCVCELTAALDVSQPKISRHLGQLRACALLADRRQGQWVYYRLHPALPAWAASLLETTRVANRHWLAEDLGRLNRMGSRPGRVAACC